MSQENVEIVRQVYEASARRDPEAVLSLYDPDVEWDMSRHPMSQVFENLGVRHGHEGLRAWFRDWYEVFDDFEHHCEELINAGEHVVSVGIDTGRGRGSGIAVERRIAGVWTIRNGKIVRVAWFPTRAEALEAAGLSE
jgi:ketosteroid isomerase-like protein